ncbi:MAG: bifunctional (p)ppGpp synthetase/guanosine-3',5'-bis(diphosphate) 3'-pyrophosphohydrolase [Myxococcota bacterium]
MSRVGQYHPNADLELIRRAYDFSQEAHTGQRRKSGDPYFIHPVGVAGIITELRLDVASVCAALLHDVIEDTAVSESDLDREFGEEVTFLVDGVTKLSKINFTSRQDRQAESFRKMVVAMAQDIRVLVVKLCDRLDNMRTLEFMSRDGQERIARETMDIYAPLANRLGFAKFRSEFQDLAFRYLNPESYDDVARAVASSEEVREAHIARVARLLTAKLAQQGFAAQVTGRPKHFYSIYRKMQDRQCNFDQVFDVTAFRVVVESVADCYAALGVIHAMWTPVPGRFKDYIALPKPNMYQSLHTTVFGPGHQRIEIQIRTHEMHQVADEGIAAHWRYKAGTGGIDPRDAAQFAWLRQLMESQTELKDPAEFLDSVKVDLFSEEVYVFTPKGDVRAFPRGATPIDFAYSIHSDLGRHVSGARINGVSVPIHHRLRNGDLVEVSTEESVQPTKEWLDWAVSARARSKIRHHLRLQQREKSRNLGHELLEQALKSDGLSLQRLEKTPDLVANLQGRFGVKNIDQLFINIGYGKTQPAEVVDFLAPKVKEDRRDAPRSIREGRIEAFMRKMTGGRSSGGILLNGEEDVLVRFTKCCNPLPGDEIVGFMTRGRGVTIHRRDCDKAFEADPERRVDVQWDPKAKVSRPVKIRFATINRPGILATVGQTFHKLGINISEAQCRAGDDGRATNTFMFLCDDLSTLKDVMRQMRRIDGVVDVERV